MTRVRYKLGGYRAVREIAPQWGHLRVLVTALRLKLRGDPPSILLLELRRHLLDTHPGES